MAWKEEGMEVTRRKSSKKYMVFGLFAGLATVTLLTVLGWRCYIRTTQEQEWKNAADTRKYRRHYVIIPDDSTSQLWQDIYLSARSAGEACSAYVEMLSAWEVGDYTPLSYMDIAVAAHVDGIIIRPDGTKKMRDAIEEADEAGIPVITVLSDDTASLRKSFVGINNYQFGATYGQQILNCVDEGTRKIAVLFKNRNNGNELIFQNLRTVLESGLPEDRKKDVKIESITMSSQSTFDAEEVIRDMIIDAASRPDILVCTNETDSESAYNAMVDYNQVGNVAIIGYYQSETILDAIAKRNVPVAITPDAEQIGRYSIEALEEYHTMGYTSDYRSIDLDVITPGNVVEYRELEMEQER